jgi:NTP pyrophosphatase (non-canonical NTP hydrolase)
MEIRMGNAKPRNPNYRQPPKAYQFQKGQTGNPRGRPKNSENLATIVEEELGRVITVVESGKRVRRTVREALVNVLFDLAVQGNQKAIDLILELTAEKGKPDDRPCARWVVDGLDSQSPEFEARQARRDKGTCYDPEFRRAAAQRRNTNVQQ